MAEHNFKVVAVLRERSHPRPAADRRAPAVCLQRKFQIEKIDDENSIARAAQSQTTDFGPVTFFYCKLKRMKEYFCKLEYYDLWEGALSSDEPRRGGASGHGAWSCPSTLTRQEKNETGRSVCHDLAGGDPAAGAAEFLFPAAPPPTGLLKRSEEACPSHPTFSGTLTATASIPRPFPCLKQHTQGVSLPARGRPLPHPHDPHHRGQPHRPHHRPGPAAQRGPGRGASPCGHDLGAHPLRPRRGAGAQRAPARRLRPLTRSPCGWWTGWRKDGQGLNLTWEVRRRHPLPHAGPDRAATLEGQLLRLADHIAYINHDIEDALRGRHSSIPWTSPCRPARCWASPTADADQTPWSGTHVRGQRGPAGNQTVPAGGQASGR